MSIVRLEVWSKNRARSEYEEVTGYFIESSADNAISLLGDIKFDLFGNRISENVYVSGDDIPVVIPGTVAYVGFLFGVTDNSAKVVEEALSLMYPEYKWKASSFKMYVFERSTAGEISSFVYRHLGNKLINKITFLETIDQQFLDRFSKIEEQLVSDSDTGDNISVSEISLEISDDSLIKLNDERCLALRLDELHCIRDFYRDEAVRKDREVAGLPLNPTDVELEVLAQTWSEHCKHKIFGAKIDYKESASVSRKLGDLKVNSLFKEYIKGATDRVRKEKMNDFTVSLFHDNAGIVRFDKYVDVAVKVETHNGPSALDPYGGALTGILGVNRDIIGTGIGAKPIANTDVFCIGELDVADSDLPKELIHPKEILKGIHKGVMDGGNKSGIPTVNGAIVFDRDYSGKPLVYCGTVGVIPKVTEKGVEGSSKHVEPGMRVVMVGGAIGADGIHGATFSSLEFDENSPSSAVQIGDPFTQKKVLEFILEARDRGLYSTLTDNGAGGLSSSVGEMATYTGGATIDLSLCPVKYSGLTPYQLVISESQERMTVAVPIAEMDSFIDLASSRGVVATDIGVFNDSGFFEIKYGGEIVAKLPLSFMHDGTPIMKLNAYWDGPLKRKTWCTERVIMSFNENYEDALLKIIADPIVASKESIVRMYDHEVQGATVVPPFSGKNNDGPNDSGVIWMYPHGGERDGALTISCGITPQLSLSDPYLMAKYAVDEAIRNSVAVGGDPDNLAILDNFCWPDPVESKNNPDGEYRAAQLVRNCVGLYEASVGFGAPLISGKDSMKNNFRSGDGTKIGVLPTLLVTAVSKADTKHLVRSDFKKTADQIFLISTNVSPFLQNSVFNKYYNAETEIQDFDVKVSLELYRKVHQGVCNNLFSSVHDISDGGLISSMVESAFGGDLGVDISLGDIKDLSLFLFGERVSSFVVSVASNNISEINSLFGDHATHLGCVVSEKKIFIRSNSTDVINLDLHQLKQKWQKEAWW